MDTGSNLLTDLKATYAWDNRGRMTNMTYPSGIAQTLGQVAPAVFAAGVLCSGTEEGRPS